MSDIDMRFDGLFTLAALALYASLYLAVALVAAVLARLRPTTRQRARTASMRAALLGAGTALAFGLALAWWARAGTYHAGADWLDMLVAPTGVAFAAGCWWLGRPW